MYILIADDEEDVLEVMALTIQTSFSGKILKAKSGNQAIEILKREGKPLFILSDYNMPDGTGADLIKFAHHTWPDLPFLVASGNYIEEVKAKMPGAYVYIEKPFLFGPLSEALPKLLAKEKKPEYVPVRLTLLLQMGMVRTDLYIRLAKERYLKVIQAKEHFETEDAIKFIKKNVVELYINAQEAPQFIQELEKALQIYLSSAVLDDSELQAYSEQALAVSVRLGKALGFTDEVLKIAHKSTALAFKAIAQNKNLLELLQRRLRQQEGNYLEHITTLSLLNAMLCEVLGWSSDLTQMKIAIATFLHDICVPEEFYVDIEEWNKKARSATNLNPEVVLYRNHPRAALEKIAELPDLPPDIDQIILQHHEQESGTGFPQKISGPRISPLSALFILAEDLTHELMRDKDAAQAVGKFLEMKAEKYSHGNFRKVFQALSLHVAELNAKSS